MLTALVSVIVFGILIGVHEAGHLIAAKLNNIKVHEFAIGMGPKIVSFSTKETKYSLRLLPIGGYCKIEGEDEESTDERALCNKAPWQKFIVIVSGALMNLVLAFVALLILLGAGKEIYIPKVGSVIPDTSAYEQGLMKGDEIVKLNNTNINIQSDITFFMSRNGEKPIEMTVKRNNELIKLNVTPYTDDGVSYIGFYPEIVKNNLYHTVTQAFYTEIFVAKVVIVSLLELFTGGVSFSEASGPVGIVSEIGKAARMGIYNIIYLLALISVNLGLFNLLPFPALDGGRAVFCIYEMITKKKVSATVESYVHAIGFLILIGLMIYVTFNDVFKLFVGWILWQKL